MSSTAVQVIQEEQGGDSELSPLGLSLGILGGALHIGLSQRLNASATEPNIMPGIHLWAGTSKGLHELLSEEGWQYHAPKNRPMLLSPDGSRQVTLLSGDPCTGLNNGKKPSNKLPKGPTLQALCLGNSGGDLFDGMLVGERSAEPPKTWVLLYHFAPSPDGGFQLRAELSLPTQYQDGFIVDWEHRIILPTINSNKILLTAEQIEQAEHYESPDIEIQRKGRS